MSAYSLPKGTIGLHNTISDGINYGYSTISWRSGVGLMFFFSYVSVGCLALGADAVFHSPHTSMTERVARDISWLRTVAPASLHARTPRFIPYTGDKSALLQAVYSDAVVANAPVVIQGVPELTDEGVRDSLQTLGKRERSLYSPLPRVFCSSFLIAFLVLYHQLSLLKSEILRRRLN